MNIFGKGLIKSIAIVFIVLQLHASKNYLTESFVMASTEIWVWCILAIMQLKKPIKIADKNKGRICLPDIYHPVDVAHDICFVTGWGITDKNANTSDSNLHYAPVAIVPFLACNMPAIYDGSLDETMICAGDLARGIDSCDGDSGGSLVCPGEDIEAGKGNFQIFCSKSSIVTLNESLWTLP